MEQSSQNSSSLKTAYRIFRWVTLASLVITILLVLHKSSPPAVTVVPAAAQEVERKFEAAAQARAQGQPARVQLDSTELNSFLAQNLELAGSSPASAAAQSDPGASPAVTPNAAPGVPAADPNASSTQQPSIEEVQSSVRDVKVDMDGDLIKTYVVFNLHGEDLSLELDGHLGAENGYMKFEPVGGKIGSLPLPQSALDAAVSQMMNSPENREKLRLPDDVSDIQIQDGQVVVSYK
jgi:hypothetical protein